MNLYFVKFIKLDLLYMYVAVRAWDILINYYVLLMYLPNVESNGVDYIFKDWLKDKKEKRKMVSLWCEESEKELLKYVKVTKNARKNIKRWAIIMDPKQVKDIFNKYKKGKIMKLKLSRVKSVVDVDV